MMLIYVILKGVLKSKYGGKKREGIMGKKIKKTAILNIRGMVVSVTMKVLSTPSKSLHDLRDEELKGRIINVKA